MKRLLTACMLCLLATAMQAIPAHPGKRQMTQPDGSTVTLRLVGDEYLHFQTTADGYSVVRDDRGYYVYARLDGDGLLAPTTLVARDEQARTAADRDYLQTVGRCLKPQMTDRQAALYEAEQQARAARRAAQRVQQYDYTKFRGLILLVEYNDCSFRYDNYRDIMDEMVNQPGYQGTDITNVNRTEGRCVGSVRDYYSDCSNGLFVPEFDVVGPVKVDRSQYFYGSDPINSRIPNGTYLMADAINAADATVDFSKYDGDGDGVVDMVYFIFAGMGSNYNGNDSRLLWPHASQLYNPYGTYNWTLRKDGKSLGRYACGTELYGWGNWTTLDGIGTICHEFGHVLGLPDFYDTDYEESGGESHHPGEWTVMAGGGYLNYGRSPAVYTLFERHALGWATPQVISAEGTYELRSIDESNTGYRLNTPTSKEYFLMENRQQTKWNAYLPGHGMLVFRVDSTNSEVWAYNTVNANPKHNYFELLRAGGWQSGQYTNESSSDPFPGTRSVTTLNNTTTPANLLTWAGKENAFGIDNIAESRQGVITFDIVDVNVVRAVSLPEQVIVGKGTSRQLTETRTPDYAPYVLQWTSSNEAVATVSATGLVTGVSEGTATITVKARSPKQSEAQAVTATCQVIVEQQTVVQTIAEFCLLEEGAEAAVTLTDAQVLYNHKGTLYVRDASGAMVVTGVGSTWKQNSVVNGSLYGTLKTVDRIPQLVATDKTDASSVSVTTGTAAEPIVRRVAEVTTGDYANLITLTRIRLQSVDGLVGLFAVQGGHLIRLYNNFGLNSKVVSLPKNYTNKHYNVNGILVTRQLGDELIDELSLMSSFSEVQVPEFTLTYSIGEGGHVVFDGQTISGDGTGTLYEEDDAVLQIVPDEGYEVEGIVLDATQIPLSEVDNGKLTLSFVTDNHSLTVFFHKAEESGIAQPMAPLSAETPVIVSTTGGTIAARTTLGGLAQLRLQPGVYVAKTPQGTIKLLRK